MVGGAGNSLIMNFVLKITHILGKLLEFGTNTLEEIEVVFFQIKISAKVGGRCIISSSAP